MQVRQPIYKTSVGRWRPYAAHLKAFREILERAAGANRQGPLATSEKKEPASWRLRAPHHPEVNSNLAREQAHMGDLLIKEGDREDATGHYQESLCLDPACVPALAAVAWHGLFPLTEYEVSRMQRLLADPRVPPGDTARLHFGLAHVHERAGAYERAFEHFRQANTLRRSAFRDAGKVFDLAWYSAWIDQIIAHCDASYFEQIKGWGRDSRRPVFVVGMPRSGCTEAERLLACHPQIHRGGELLEIGRLMAGLQQKLPEGEYYPKVMWLSAALCRSFADHYGRTIEQLSAQAARVTDRTPNNFQFLGLIAALFPKAQVIHCRRDPLDVCFSCYIQDFMECTLNLDEVAIFYREYERLMAHWRNVLPLAVLEVAYEDLVLDPEMVSRRMVSFCDLKWDEHCLDFRADARGGRVLPEHQSTVGRWRLYAAHLQSLASAPPVMDAK
jgi:tetratricopeptide (TPR) repeat protein